MNKSIGTTYVDEIMTRVVITVRQTDKLAAVAKLFEQNDLNAAPVVDESNVCVGIITSHDIVEYETARMSMEKQFKQGTSFDLAHYGDGLTEHVIGRVFDGVAFHMTKDVSTTDSQSSLSRVARAMCQKHFHHMVVVDEGQHPIGMLSSLDILGHILGEPVVRRVRPNTPIA